jgi:16S rRNA (cytidine1402-2'-O)-methyltransferase
VLTLVPTPLGNLRDITLRALDTLREADLIAAEDTRHTAHLLAAYEISCPTLSLHEHNEDRRIPEILDRLEQGLKIALVSDAGTPLLSDPGFRLVRACLAAGITVEALPGPSAITMALSLSGLPPLPFHFGGFLPVKSGRRAKELSQALQRLGSSIYFESPHRIRKSLECLVELEPASRVCLAREMTKKFEEILRGSALEVLGQIGSRNLKGEITVVIAGAIAPACNSSEDETVCS